MELQKMGKLVTFIVVVFCLGFCQSQHTFEGQMIKAKKMMEHLPQLNKLNGNLAKLFHYLDATKMLKAVEEFWEDESNNSSECMSVLQYALKNFDKYALNMLDATAKPPPAIGDGALQWVGGFNMCMSNPPPQNYRGPGSPPRSHYCRVTFSERPSTSLIDLNPKMTIGVCLPEPCGPEDIDALIKYAIDEVKKLAPKIPLPSVLNNDAVYCAKRTEELPFSTSAIIMIVITSLFGFVICLGTIYDIFVFQLGKEYFFMKEMTPQLTIQNDITVSNETDGQNGYGQLMEETDDAKIETKGVIPPSDLRVWQKMLLAFSLYTNAGKIIDTKQQPGRLNCLDGIRFLSMSWVILGHTYFFLSNYINNLGTFYPLMFQRWTNEAIVNATFSVDSFFVLSGLLTAYMFLKEANRMTTIKSVKLWVLYFFHRYWRLTPPYMLFLGFYTALYKYMSNGPFFTQDLGIDEPYCSKNWWTNLLYVNNIVDSKEMCMGWTWYLANDMQFHYLIAPLILPLIFLFGKWGTIPGGVIALISFIAAGVISQNHALGTLPLGSLRFPYSKVYLAAVIITPIIILLGSLIVTGVISSANQYGPVSFDAFDSIYIKPWCRVSPYITGLLLGYLILEHQKRRWRLHRAIVIVGWLVATGLGLSVIYGLAGVNDGSYKLSVEVSALYNSVSRFVWSLSLGWLIYACLTGNGGWINQFLSWPGFIPLSRLTYCAYLVHPVVITLVYQSLQFPPVVTTLTMVYYFFGHITAAYLVAFVLSLVWESPLIGLEKILLKKN